MNASDMLRRYLKGQNVAIEYRWAEGRYDRLPELAADLVRRRVSVIVANSTPASIAAKAATSTIPIVFGVGDDPVKLGLVANLGRPGGNATGVNFFVGELAAKRLDLLRELVPSAARVAVLVNPSDPVRTASNLRDVETAARAIGLQIQVLKANTVSEIDMAFTTLARERADALFVVPDAFFNSRRVQLAILAARHTFPAAFGQRDFVEVGGLMSYGTNLPMRAGRSGSIRVVSSRALSPPTYRSFSHPLSSSSSTSRPLGRSASRLPRASSPAPTR